MRPVPTQARHAWGSRPTGRSGTKVRTRSPGGCGPAPRPRMWARGRLVNVRTSAVGLGVAVLGAVGDVEVLLHAHALELGDVSVPLVERTLAEDEPSRVLPDVVTQGRLPQRDLLALKLAQRR